MMAKAYVLFGMGAAVWSVVTVGQPDQTVSGLLMVVALNALIIIAGLIWCLSQLERASSESCQHLVGECLYGTVFGLIGMVIAIACLFNQVSTDISEYGLISCAALLGLASFVGAMTLCDLLAHWAQGCYQFSLVWIWQDRPTNRPVATSAVSPSYLLFWGGWLWLTIFYLGWSEDSFWLDPAYGCAAVLVYPMVNLLRWARVRLQVGRRRRRRRHLSYV